MTLLRITLAILICAFGYQTSFASELDVRDQIAVECTNHLGSGRFDELETLIEHYRASHEPTPSGAWKLAVCYLGIQNLYANPTEKHDADRWGERHAIVQDWRKQVPQSAAARLVEAMLMIEEARQLRRNKLASKDPISMMRIAAKKMKQARQHLLGSKKILAHDPH